MWLDMCGLPPYTLSIQPLSTNQYSGCKEQAMYIDIYFFYTHCLNNLKSENACDVTFDMNGHTSL